MIATIRTITRTLIEDNGSSSYEEFEYTISSIFTITQSNITITKVLKNGVELESGEYSFDEVTNKITISDLSPNGLVSGDRIEVDYTFYKYSDAELDKFIKGALAYLSLYSFSGFDEYEIISNNISPIPNFKMTRLIAIITSILILPDYTTYRMGDINIQYSKKLTKEERIEKTITKFKFGLGNFDIITWDEHNSGVINIGDDL